MRLPAVAYAGEVFIGNIDLRQLDAAAVALRKKVKIRIESIGGTWTGAVAPHVAFGCAAPGVAAIVRGRATRDQQSAARLPRDKRPRSRER